MSSPKRQRTVSNSFPGSNNSSAISNSLFGFLDPFYASELKLARTMLRDTKRFVTLEKPQTFALVVEYRMIFTLLAYCFVPQLTNHTEPTINDLFLMFAIKERQRINWPKLILLYMLEFSVETSGSLGYPLLISRIIKQALLDVSDTPFILTNISQHFLLGTYIHHHLDI
ncbi:hypothetical protein Lal_00014539 [Lupinus albus]|nr:hypothetical protein Lal_00014539 [Lupinus albus]